MGSYRGGSTIITRGQFGSFDPADNTGYSSTSKTKSTVTKKKLSIRKNKHMTINTDIRSNMKRRNKTKKNKQLLKKRIKVEHLNARLLTSFKGLSTMKYSNLDRLKALFYLAFSIQIFEYFEERV